MTVIDFNRGKGRHDKSYYIVTYNAERRAGSGHGFLRATESSDGCSSESATRTPHAGVQPLQGATHHTHAQKTKAR